MSWNRSSDPGVPRPPRVAGEGGYATAEAAVALPSLLVVLAVAVGVLLTVSAQLRCVDAARAAARAASRGDPDAAAVGVGRTIAPAGARVTVSHSGRDVAVAVDVTVRFTHWLPGLHVGARAVAEAEAGAP